MMNPAPLNRTQWAAVLVASASVLALLVNWGGTAQPGSSFVLGVAVFMALQLGFAAFTYWLLFAPRSLPASSSQNTQNPQRGLLRQLAAIGVLSGGFLFGFAATWDEAWHRQFGGFGNDFWWRPHLLLYGSFALISLMAASSLLWLGLNGRGDLRTRARAEPFITLLALIGGFLALSAPSDELWHRIYGLDLTAWSLPHTTVVFAYCALMLCGVCLALSGAPRGQRRDWRHVAGGEWLSLALISAVSLQVLQFATTEWEGARPEALSRALSLRPEWLFPVVLVSAGALLGHFANAALRRPGVASAVAGLALLERFVTLRLFAGFEHGMSLDAYLLFALPMIAVDLWSALRGHWVRFDWLGAGAALIAALTVMLLLMPALVAYPRVNPGTAPWMLLYGTLAGLAASWAGWRLGGGAWSIERLETNQSLSMARVTLTALGGAALVVALAVLTAQTPV